MRSAALPLGAVQHQLDALVFGLEEGPVEAGVELGAREAVRVDGEPPSHGVDAIARDDERVRGLNRSVHEESAERVRGKRKGGSLRGTRARRPAQARAPDARRERLRAPARRPVRVSAVIARPIPGGRARGARSRGRGHAALLLRSLLLRLGGFGRGGRLRRELLRAWGRRRPPRPRSRFSGFMTSARTTASRARVSVRRGRRLDPSAVLSPLALSETGERRTRFPRKKEKNHSSEETGRPAV